jgi:hypothetical protein
MRCTFQELGHIPSSQTNLNNYGGAVLDSNRDATANITEKANHLHHESRAQPQEAPEYDEARRKLLEVALKWVGALRAQSKLDGNSSLGPVSLT